jgi:PAS domain S-box-containing protein
LLALHELLTDNVAQQRQARHPEQLVSEKLDFESKITNRTGFPATTSVLFIGKQRMDAIRKQLAGVIRVEEQLMRLRGQQIRVTYQHTNRLTLLLTVLASLAFGLSYFLNQQEVKHRQQVENTLRVSERRFRSLVDSLETIVFQAGPTGAWTYLNPAWERVTGFLTADSLGHFFMDYILKEDQEAARLNFEQILNNQQVQAKHVIRFRTRSGGYRWLEVQVQAVKNDDQTHQGAVGLLTDITDRKLAEEALIESEQRFRQIAENVDDMFWIRDLAASCFLYINPAYEKFTGPSPCMSAQRLFWIMWLKMTGLLLKRLSGSRTPTLRISSEPYTRIIASTGCA